MQCLQNPEEGARSPESIIMDVDLTEIHLPLCSKSWDKAPVTIPEYFHSWSQHMMSRVGHESHSCSTEDTEPRLQSPCGRLCSIEIRHYVMCRNEIFHLRKERDQDWVVGHRQ